MDFSFGDRPTKKLSLRGKSKQDQDRDQIIAQARKQRAEAKLLKLQNNAAKRIQRVYKTYRTRKFVKSQQRKQFDEIVATSKCKCTLCEHDLHFKLMLKPYKHS